MSTRTKGAAAPKPAAPSKPVVHVVTRIQTVFGVLDEGNVRSHTPINLEIQGLTEDDFAGVLKGLLKARADLQQQVDAAVAAESEEDAEE